VARIIKRIFILLLIILYAQPAEASFKLGKKGPRISGFLEVAFGYKLGHDLTKRDEYNILEERFQLKTTIYPKFSKILKKWNTEINFKGDFIVDQYYGSETDFDLRELNILTSPFSWMDLKIGRQIFTWGTGDYLFVNDLFPKNYISFYIGRDDEYLKEPSDGIKVSLFSKLANLDLIALPLFEPNTIPKGDRLSFFDSFQGGIAGRRSDRHLIEPSRKFKNVEYAGRLYKNLGSYEGALYGFRGFYRMPNSYLNEQNRDLFYPRLDAYGASLRGPVLSGIGNIEFAYYNSIQDTNGNNRLIQNSQLKGLVGYSKDLGNDWGAGVQYMLEQTLDYDELKAALLPNDYCWDELRHLTTLRITKLLMDQTLRVNLFGFFSPSDLDGYLRPSIDYDLNDNVKVSVGTNLAWGRDDITEFGQMENNKNIYIRVRGSF